MGFPRLQAREDVKATSQTGRIGIDHPTVVPRNAVPESETDDCDEDE